MNATTTYRLTKLAQALGILALGVALMLVMHHFGMLNRWVVLSILGGAASEVLKDSTRRINRR